ncbi:hypothetical protein RCS94_09215 [Orbaceae bacterium ac157xtp]
MFKKLLVVSEAVFVLTGCGKEVTEDMLVGQWKCDYKALYDIENTSRDYRNYVINDILNKYEKNDRGMTRQAYTLPPEEFTFIRLDDSPYSGVDRTTEYKVTKEYIYVSDNEFKHVETRLFRNRKTKEHEELNVFTKTCVRQETN